MAKMIDTIKFTLDRRMFWPVDGSKFQKGITNLGHGYGVLVQNPSKREMTCGIYKPRLTLANRFNTTGNHELTLSVELSLPKLVYGNNFDELQDSDFDRLVDLLKSALDSMGIKVFRDLLAKAPVSAIHYSKNIPLTDGSTTNYIISKLKEAGLSAALDTNQTDYKNGCGFKWHCNTYEIGFYDKIKDLETAKKWGDKRAVESQNAIQLSLFDALQCRKTFEVLRMEVRLGCRTKITSLFTKLGIGRELIFKDLFDSATSKTVLRSYLEEIEAHRPRLLDCVPSDAKSLIADIKLSNPSLSAAHVLQLLGVKSALESMGHTELRSMLGYKARNWYRLLADVRSIKPTISRDPLAVVRNNLMEFKPLKLVDFQERMINNDKYK
jgi:hypothetical protein